MRLSKDDLQAIGTVVDEKLKGTEQRLVTEMARQFTGQNKLSDRHFADLKVLMENSYVSREEFEQVKEDYLQNEVDDLKKQVQALQKHLHTPS
jgi:polyhydroxyalkanoate synthesis regulator phasin